MVPVNRKRDFMKSGFYTEEARARRTDQMEGLLQPPFEKSAPPSAIIIELPKPTSNVVSEPDLFTCMTARRSHRKFSESSVTLEELSFLLWATQGVREVIPGRTYRTVPSAGSRHPYETYLGVNHVSGLEPGIYRYLALSHRLIQVALRDDMAKAMARAVGSVKWVERASVVFVWAATPYRCEWRYAEEAARVMLLDAGHLCQNLYLASEAIGCGTCAIGAYRQVELDGLLGLDGREEFAVYCAALGKVLPPERS